MCRCVLCRCVHWLHVHFRGVHVCVCVCISEVCICVFVCISQMCACMCISQVCTCVCISQVCVCICVCVSQVCACVCISQVYACVYVCISEVCTCAHPEFISSGSTSSMPPPLPSSLVVTSLCSCSQLSQHAGDLNSGPHACIAGTGPTEPTPQLCTANLRCLWSLPLMS